jgi:hypothetical protein
LASGAGTWPPAVQCGLYGQRQAGRCTCPQQQCSIITQTRGRGCVGVQGMQSDAEERVLLYQTTAVEQVLFYQITAVQECALQPACLSPCLPPCLPPSLAISQAHSPVAVYTIIRSVFVLPADRTAELARLSSLLRNGSCLPMLLWARYARLPVKRLQQQSEGRGRVGRPTTTQMWGRINQSNSLNQGIK